MGELVLFTEEDLPVFGGESYEDHVSGWLAVDTSLQGHYWALGSIAASLEKRYGEDVMGKFASDVRSSRTRIREYALTYRTWQNDERSSFLSFHHHTIAARFEDPQLALKVAGDEDLSTRELEEFISTGELPARNVHFSSETSEWYTPQHIVTCVIDAIGQIELDPCAEPEKRIPALNYYTKEADGLAQKWFGAVYMNPPYRKGKEMRLWVSKLVASHKSGEVPRAIALVPARTDTAWFALLRDYPRCFIRGRLKFSGQENSAPFPSAAFYLGDEKKRFIEAFADLGDTYEWVEA